MKTLIKITTIIILMFTRLQPAFGTPILSSEEKNLLVLCNATFLDSTSLGVFRGIAPDDMLNGNGTFNSSGWTWNLSGTYLSSQLNLNYIGTFDIVNDTVSWTGTGNYGTEPWLISGTAAFKSDDTIDWYQTGKIGTASDWWSLGCSFKLVFDGGISLSAISCWGTYNGTQARVDATMNYDKNKGKTSGSLSVRPVHDPPDVHWVSLNPECTVQEGSVRTETTIPEPATICLLGLGGLALLRRKRGYEA